MIYGPPRAPTRRPEDPRERVKAHAAADPPKGAAGPRTASDPKRPFRFDPKTTELKSTLAYRINYKVDFQNVAAPKSSRSEKCRISLGMRNFGVQIGVVGVAIATNVPVWRNGRSKLLTQFY